MDYLVNGIDFKWTFHRGDWMWHRVPYNYRTSTVKPAHAVTSIKQSHVIVLRGQSCLVLSEKIKFHMNWTSLKTTFSLSQMWPFNTGLTVSETEKFQNLKLHYKIYSLVYLWLDQRLIFLIMLKIPVD